MITFMGFLFNITPHILMLFLNESTFAGEVPPLFCICIGIAYFLYMICDNTDGKHARNTGTSSPLGMLFDHGIDSFTAVVCNMTF
jgi:ethanolaminephosphotransferase